MPHINHENKFEVAKMHLDRFWHEIFWRRENEQKIAVWSVGLFAAVLALVYGHTGDIEFNQKVLLALLPALLGVLSSWYLFQNWRKDKEIAYLIVQLNEALGAWEEDYLIPGSALYPIKWKEWGIDPATLKNQWFGKFVTDKVSLSYFFFTLCSSFVCIIGILTK